MIDNRPRMNSTQFHLNWQHFYHRFPHTINTTLFLTTTKNEKKLPRKKFANACDTQYGWTLQNGDTQEKYYLLFSFYSENPISGLARCQSCVRNVRIQYELSKHSAVAVNIVPRSHQRFRRTDSFCQPLSTFCRVHSRGASTQSSAYSVALLKATLPRTSKAPFKVRRHQRMHPILLKKVFSENSSYFITFGAFLFKSRVILPMIAYLQAYSGKLEKILRFSPEILSIFFLNKCFEVIQTVDLSKIALCPPVHSRLIEFAQMFECNHSGRAFAKC